MSASTTSSSRSRETAISVPGALARGAIGGLVAGAVFIALNAWFASSMGDPAKGPLMMISTILQGEQAMQAGTASPVLGSAIHAVLSIAFGMLFALVAVRLRSNGARALAGTGYGALLYVVNFLVISPLAFPIFEMANQPFELATHVVFGAVLSFAFYERSAASPAPAARTA